jgi:phospholipase/lecithinase/hemolysin
LKILHLFTLVALFFAANLFPAHAAYSSLYVFGDALSSTTDNPDPRYYGHRYSNGRIWVEVLAQRQGLVYDASRNNSYYDHNSAALVTQINGFSKPVDVTNDLFIVWVCNADTFDAAQDLDTSNQWVAANNLSQTNHLQIITNLYAKGVRTLILPNAVDISKIPAFNTSSSFTNVMRAGCIDYNIKFSNTVSQARALCPGLKIQAPDFFNLLNNVLTNASFYGLTNALKNGLSIDALDDPLIFNIVSTNGPGTNYIFWDKTNPTAKFHAVIAEVAQQLISPVQVSQVTAFTGSNQLDVVNMPVGLNGFVDGVNDMSLTSWTVKASFSCITTTQSVFVTFGGPQWFYRLRFPYAWSWP